MDAKLVQKGCQNLSQRVSGARLGGDLGQLGEWVAMGGSWPRLGLILRGFWIDLGSFSFWAAGGLPREQIGGCAWRIGVPGAQYASGLVAARGGWVSPALNTRADWWQCATANARVDWRGPRPQPCYYFE